MFTRFPQSFKSFRSPTRTLPEHVASEVRYEKGDRRTDHHHRNRVRRRLTLSRDSLSGRSGRGGVGGRSCESAGGEGKGTVCTSCQRVSEERSLKHTHT